MFCRNTIDCVDAKIADLKSFCSGLKDELHADLAQSGIDTNHTTLVSLIGTNMKEVNRAKDAILVNLSEMRVILTKMYGKQAKAKRLQKKKTG